MDSLPVLSDSSQQPAWCRDPRPRSSQTSPCNEDEKVRRYFLHESNPKGCKIFGICPNDAAKYDNETTEYIYSEYNYFLSFEECQVECMQRESRLIMLAICTIDCLFGWFQMCFVLKCPLVRMWRFFRTMPC